MAAAGLDEPDAACAAVMAALVGPEPTVTTSRCLGTGVRRQERVAMPVEDCAVRWVGPAAMVALPAEIDAGNSDEIGQELLSAISLGAAVVVIDMSPTTFCDSAGVQAIITAYRHAARTAPSSGWWPRRCCAYSPSSGPTSWSPSTRPWKQP
jgi:hypothetical protein